MKKSLFLLFSVLLFISVNGEAVYDVNGAELRGGSGYYIVEASGGGALSSILHKGVLTVAQTSSNLGKDLELAFYTANFTTQVQLLGFTEIIFIRPPPFDHPGRWEVPDAADNAAGRQYVTVSPSPVLEPTDWFKIGKFDDASYKLLYCPNATETSACSDLGIYSEGGERVLGLSNEPLRVVFVDSLNVINRASD